MINVFQEEVLDTLIKRVQSLTAQSKPMWGKMNISQMLAHCNESSKVAMGTIKAKRMFAGKLLGKIVLRKILKNNKPLKKNSPTSPDFLVTSQKEFINEKEDFIRILSKLKLMSIEDFNGKIHPFFGEMNGREWGILLYKHYNHHLTQFDV